MRINEKYSHKDKGDFFFFSFLFEGVVTGIKGSFSI